MVAVIYVQRTDAKTAKNELEAIDMLHKDYRLTPGKDGLIAIPVRRHQQVSCFDQELSVKVHGNGEQDCPLSTAKLGNHASAIKGNLTIVESTLMGALSVHHHATDKDNWILDRLRKLTISTLPKKLELFGDDRTIVIPQRALDIDQDPTYAQLLCDCETSSTAIWRALADSLHSHRVVRRGEIDPDSGIRKSTFSILWYCEQHYSSKHNNNSSSSSPPTWITVTEDGIRQSFDVTKVMFSRGNGTEKRRFGRSLVQPNERVLDLYAGIGYFTLPALVHGQAQHVTCCEWNPDAVEALRYNLKDNNVADNRVTILVGDCRRQLLESCYDRISLGLLPSSEGGWSTAIQALNPRGGWLHVHGNVPVAEVEQWALWVAWELLQKLRTMKTLSSVLVHHVEKVKSFAPKVLHCVADLQIGLDLHPDLPNRSAAVAAAAAGVVTRSSHGHNHLIICDSTVDPPSCALSETGVLHQRWMMSMGDDSMLSYNE